MLPVARSARFVSWGNAVLSGRVSPDEAADRVTAGDLVHRVVALLESVPAATSPSLPGTPSTSRWSPVPEALPRLGSGDGPEAVSLPVALARLRALRVSGLRLSLPVPGDPVGLPGPPPFTTVAVAAGEAVLTVGGPALGLVPAAENYVGPLGRGQLVIWQVHPVRSVAGTGGPTLAEADRELRETLAEATSALVALDVARWRPELAGALAQLRGDPAMADVLSPGYSGRAASVLALARRVGGIAQLADRSGDGAAVSATETARRTAVLRDLARASRQAQLAAYNAVLEPGRR